MPDNNKDFLYSQEWEQQHTVFSWQRFHREYEERQKYIASLPLPMRLIYKARVRARILKTDFLNWFNWYFRKEFRNECEQLIKEANRERRNDDSRNT